MRKNLFSVLMGVGLVSLGAFSFLMGKQALFVIKSYYSNHSTYDPIPKDQVKEEKPLVILITAHNVESGVERNLRSVLEQNYSNYRIIYVDNASTDKTYYIANEWIRKYQLTDSTEFIRNHEKKPLSEILFFAIHDLSDEEVVVLLDGKDWLSHTAVLSELNRYYNDDQVWMTYAQFSSFPDYQRGDARSPILSNNASKLLRAAPWIYSKYSSFYAGLFKQIKMKDLLYEGSFIKGKTDRAIMMPMLEMAENHAVFIPEILYVKNQEVEEIDHSDDSESIKAYSRYIRSLKPYEKLTKHPKYQSTYEQETDLIVFSSDRPMQLYGFLETQRKYANQMNDVYVIYSVTSDKYDEGYDLVKHSFPEVYFVKYDNQSTDIRSEIVSLIKKATSAHITIAQDQCLLKDRLDIGRAINYLEKTGAYGFYFSLGLNLEKTPEHYYAVDEDILAWQFKEGPREWGQSLSLGMTLYRKEDLIDSLSRIQFSTLREMMSQLEQKKNSGQLGVCFSESRSLKRDFQVFRGSKGVTELLYTPEELNEMFLEGLKMNTQEVYRYKNRKIEVEGAPHFISR